MAFYHCNDMVDRATDLWHLTRLGDWIYFWTGTYDITRRGSQTGRAARKVDQEQWESQKRLWRSLHCLMPQ